MAIWAAAVGFGEVALARFEMRSGPAGAPPSTWPVDATDAAGATLVRTDGAATLVLFAHPFCPCTRATLIEFERLLTGLEDRGVRCTAHVILTWDGDDGKGPAALDDVAGGAPGLEAQARALPGASVTRDVGARLAQRFDVQTSGELLVYDRAGRLGFRGGLTPARGHVGETAAARAIVDLLAADGSAATAPVFGCPLFTPPSAGSP